MTVFRFQAIAADGTLHQDSVEAETEEDAARLLTRRGLKPYRLEHAAARTKSTMRERWRVAALERIFSTLHVLLQAGLTIDAALRTALANERRKPERDLLEGVSGAMAAGQPFSAAISGRVALPVTITAILTAGEASARMTETFAAITEIYAERRQRRDNILSALLYPATLLLVMLAALGIVTFVLVPSIQPIFEGAGQPMPMFIGILSAFGDLFSDYDWAFALIAIVGLASVYAMLRAPSGRRRLAQAALSLPLLGTVLRQRSSATYLKTLSLLLGNGVALGPALELAADAVPFETDRQALRSLRDAVFAGQSLSGAVEKTGILDAVTLSFFKAGEQSNQLPDALARASALLDAQAKQTSERFSALLTPAITIVTGLAVGGIVVSVMDTLLSVNDVALR